MSDRDFNNNSPCQKCSRACAKCKAHKTKKPNSFEKLIYKILKMTPLGCNGESWHCFLKTKHMLMYGISSAVFFVIGTTTDVIFEKKVEDLLFHDDIEKKREPVRTAFDPQTKEYFKIKAVIRRTDTGERTAILESVPQTPEAPQKITSHKLLIRPQITPAEKSL